MKFLEFILIFSLILNSNMQVDIPCDMKFCNLSKKVASCCKKEVIQRSKCCCAKMTCKITTKYNDALLLPIEKLSISFESKYLSSQQAFATVNKAVSFCFLAMYFHRVNPSSKNNIPLLT